MSLLGRRPPALGEPLSRAARIAAAALGKRWQLPAATNEVRVLRGVDVPMRDGAVLRADVYLPASSAAWMIRIESSWSGLPHWPNIIAPRQSGLTLTPVRPSERISMRRQCPWQRAWQTTPQPVAGRDSAWTPARR